MLYNINQTSVDLIFYKTLVGSDIGYESKPSRQLRLYRIVDETDQVIAQFFYDEDKQFLRVNDARVKVEAVEKLFRRSAYLIVDETSQKHIGEIKIKGQGISHFWKDVPSDPNAIINLNGVEYYFRRIAPDVSYNVLKKDSWGHFKFILYSAKGKDVAYYSLKIDLPIISKPNYTKYRPFKGTVETNFKNLQAIALAFYLFEIEFEAEDQKYDG